MLQLKMAVFWVVSRILVDYDRCFRWDCCLYYESSTLFWNIWQCLQYYTV